jgi:hypothetical protein
MVIVIVGVSCLEDPMRRINNYRIFKETTEEMVAGGRFKPSLMITFVDRSGRHTHMLAPV